MLMILDSFRMLGGAFDDSIMNAIEVYIRAEYEEKRKPRVRESSFSVRGDNGGNRDGNQGR